VVHRPRRARGKPADPHRARVNDWQDPTTSSRKAETWSQPSRARVACLGLAFKANIDDFRESPARLVAATLARRFGKRIQWSSPMPRELPIEFTDTGAELIDIDTALENATS
jgi:UDP-N-acetyl-D-mannosaminuronic acid dehydrogenase